MKKYINQSNLSYFFLFLSFFFFFYHLGNIPKIYFDEFHYLPAAKQWLLMNPIGNVEHPPLGKYLIALGIQFFGDNPVGWRASSAIFGSISIMTIFLIGELTLKDLVLASFVSLFSMFNFWIYVQSRIGMLDIFMITFLLLAFYYYVKFKYKTFLKTDYYLSSIFWGLAVAIKWSAAFMLLPFLLMLLFTNFSISNFKNIIYFGLLSMAVYFVTFFPYMFVEGQYKMSFLQIFVKTPFLMLKLQESVPANHPYSSAWYTWPLMIRPVWYEFIHTAGNTHFRGVVLLGNPFQMFVGALSVFWLIFRIKKNTSLTNATLVLFLCSWLVWAIVPRDLLFFYYFFPSAIFYSFLISFSVNEVFDLNKSRIILGVLTIISIGFFIYFFPILSGEEALEATRTKWHWLQSWI
jgi:dolichyl-phosphate-mannose--protein O-mannosyl transferase